MDEKILKEISTFQTLQSYCTCRAAGFKSMECLGGTVPSFSNSYYINFLDATNTTMRLATPGDPGRPCGGPDAESARRLYLRARACCLASDLGSPDRGLPEELARSISGSPDRPEALRWLLCAAALAERAAPARGRADIPGALLGLPPDEAYAGELLAALASSSMKCYRDTDYVRGEELLARAFARGVPAPGAGPADPLLSFGSLLIRSAYFDSPDYGPGAAMPEYAGGLANCLAFVPALPDPHCAALLPVHIRSALADSKDKGRWLKGMRLAAGRGLPEGSPFRLAWDVLTADFSLPPCPAGRSGPGTDFLDFLSKTAAAGLLGAFGETTGPALSAMVNVADFFAKRILALDADGIESAVRILAPLRASGELRPWAFNEFIHIPMNRRSTDVQRAVMRAAADGLFGCGDALVHAVTNASVARSPLAAGPGEGPPAPLTGHAAAANELLLRAASDSAPYGTRLAAAVVKVSGAAGKAAVQAEAIRALASLSPDLPEPPHYQDFPAASGRRAAGRSRGRGGPARTLGEARTLHLYAFATALILACWGRDDPGHERLAGLLKHLPERSRIDPVFLDTILPGACNLAMGGPIGIVGGLGMITAALSEEAGLPAGRVGLRALNALGMCLSLHSIPFPIPALLESLRGAALRHLAGPLPPDLRSALVTSLMIAHARMGLDEEAEYIFLDNALMLLPAQGATPPGVPRRGSGEGIPGDPGRDVSWPWPLGREPRAPGPAGRRASGAGRRSVRLAGDGSVVVEPISPSGAGRPGASARRRDPALELEAALGGGMSPDGWGTLSEWLRTSRQILMIGASPELEDLRETAESPLPVMLEDESAEPSNEGGWEAFAQALADGSAPREILDNALLKAAACLVREADPGDRLWALRESVMSLTCVPVLSPGDGSIIVTLDRVAPLPLAASAAVLQGLGSYGPALFCLLNDTRPWFMTRMKAGALAGALEQSREEGDEIPRSLADSLCAVYEDCRADPRDIARIRRACGSSAGRAGQQKGPGLVLMNPLDMLSGFSLDKAVKAARPSAKAKPKAKAKGKGKGRGPGKGGGGKRR